MLFYHMIRYLSTKFRYFGLNLFQYKKDWERTQYCVKVDIMKFMLGANYWGADYGTEMWLHYDGARIRQEMKQLYEYGVR